MALFWTLSISQWFLKTQAAEPEATRRIGLTPMPRPSGRCPLLPPQQPPVLQPPPGSSHSDPSSASSPLLSTTWSLFPPERFNVQWSGGLQKEVGVFKRCSPTPRAHPDACGLHLDSHLCNRKSNLITEKNQVCLARSISIKPRRLTRIPPQLNLVSFFPPLLLRPGHPFCSLRGQRVQCSPRDPAPAMERGSPRVRDPQLSWGQGQAAPKHLFSRT